MLASLKSKVTYGVPCPLKKKIMNGNPAKILQTVKKYLLYRLYIRSINVTLVRSCDELCSSQYVPSFSMTHAVRSFVSPAI